MGTPLVQASLLSPTTAARVAACGHQVVYHRPDGASPGRWACGSSWCQWCGQQRRRRATAAIASRLETSPDVVMLTLTIPHRADLSAEYLASQIRLVAAIWRDTMSRVRWNRYHQAAGRPASVRPPGAPRPHPEYSTTWRGDRWESSAPAGVWGREVTAGRGTRGFHVHMHVALPDVASAELVNAAWQESCQAAGVVGRGRWTNTDIRTMPHTQASYYVSKYITKAEASTIPATDQRAYVEGIRGMRRCDAWGKWRPLGLSRRDEGDATHISQPGWEYAVSLADYYGESDTARELRLGISPTPDSVRVSGVVGEDADPLELRRLTMSRAWAIERAWVAGVAVPIRGPDPAAAVAS